MEHVTLPKELEVIEEEAFYKCEALQEIELPSTLRTIGKRAFYQCGLKHLQLPDHLAFIGESAFLKCRSLAYVKIPKSVKSIEKWAFHGCGNLKILEIHHDPETVGDWITNKNCTIRCKKGSKMQEYAEKYGMCLEFV